MRKIYLTIASLAAASVGWISCTDTEELDSRLTEMEGVAGNLEQMIADINENAISAYKIIKEGGVIMSVHAHENGTVYRLDLSDGSAIDIHIASDGTGVTPIIGVNPEGEWIYSIDGGNEFNVIGHSGDTGTAKAAPQFRVNADSVWELSTDGGLTWKEVTDAHGNKMPANTGKFTDSFFESADYDEENGKLILGLATGENIEIPISKSMTMTVTGYTEGMTINFGETLTLPVTFSEDVEDVTIRQCPEGWRVRITEDGNFMVTVPASGEETEYTVTVWLQSEEVSGEKFIRSCDFIFNLGAPAQDTGAAL